MTFYFGEISTEIEYLNLSSGLPLNLTQLLCLLQLQFPYLLTGNSKKLVLPSLKIVVSIR